MSWKNQLRNDSVPWLLEPENPGVHYLALRDLFDLPSDDRTLKSARRLAHKEEKKQPNKWITLRALRVLKAIN